MEGIASSLVIAHSHHVEQVLKGLHIVTDHIIMCIQAKPAEPGQGKTTASVIAVRLLLNACSDAHSMAA
jgi:hypothetical protein